MQVYCHFCDKHLDSKVDVEHWDEDGRCEAELEHLRHQHEALFDPCDYEDQAHWGDYINKATKENNDRTTKRSDHPPDWGNA